MTKKHKAQSHDDDHIDETWLIPYADLLTLLLALFIVLFASSSIDAKKYDQIMVSFNEILSGGTGEYPQYEIIVSGHTDDRPIHTFEFESNWDLSSKRALNFMRVLLLNKDIGPARFSAVGYGEYRPQETNKIEEGRAANRRVEVSIIRNFPGNKAESIDVKQ